MCGEKPLNFLPTIGRALVDGWQLRDWSLEFVGCKTVKLCCNVPGGVSCSEIKRPLVDS
jgi:hypothetical protein